MFPGSTSYNEGQFSPKRGSAHKWHVWCATGAIEVIEKREYEAWLSGNPDTPYLISFANGSAAHITPLPTPALDGAR